MEEKNNNQKRNLSGMLKTFDDVSFFKLESLISTIPYFLFVVVIGIFYIWNNHRGVEMVRDSREVNQQLLEKQFYYNATKDSLTQHSRQSTVAKMVDTLHMQELSNPPFTINGKNGEH